MYKLNVNEKTFEVNVPSDTPLLWVIREELELTGTKYGCGKGLCGACSISINGFAVRSCIYPVSNAIGKSITTIEFLAQNGQLEEIQKAWIKFNVPQCGYCQSGQIIAATVYIQKIKNKNNKITENEIKKSMKNICRCGTYNRIYKAIKHVVDIGNNTK
tara:strand:- start:955 stop:1431 length:477 start_codon:yes stop_codon:yes gene_type:complete